jgi:hypothetical protein
MNTKNGIIKQILLIILLTIMLTGCSKSLVKTEWIDISDDITLEFITNDMGKIHFGDESVIMHYKYEHPRIIISSRGAADMIGVIEGKKMTFGKDIATFIKK